MTFVDIMIYSDIRTVVQLYNRQISRDHPNLAKWYEELSQTEAVAEYDNQLGLVCKEWRLEV